MQGGLFLWPKLGYSRRIMSDAASRNIALALLLLSLASCGREAEDTGPGGVGTEDAKALDEAAAELDAQRLDPQPLNETPNQQGKAEKK